MRSELLRWFCVLPAALLACFVVKMFVGLFMRLVFNGSATPADLDLVYYLRLLVYYSPKEAAFVVAGAMMAPRRRLITTAVLVVIGILVSLTIHVLGQRNVGLANYTHFGAEAVGAVVGAAYIYFKERRRFDPPPSSHVAG